MRTIIFLSAIMISIAINEPSVMTDVHYCPQGYAVILVVVFFMDIIEWIKKVFY